MPENVKIDTEIEECLKRGIGIDQVSKVIKWTLRDESKEIYTIVDYLNGSAEIGEGMRNTHDNMYIEYIFHKVAKDKKFNYIAVPYGVAVKIIDLEPIEHQIAMLIDMQEKIIFVTESIKYSKVERYKNLQDLGKMLKCKIEQKESIYYSQSSSIKSWECGIHTLHNLVHLVNTQAKKMIYDQEGKEKLDIRKELRSLLEISQEYRKKNKEKYFEKEKNERQKREILKAVEEVRGDHFSLFPEIDIPDDIEDRSDWDDLRLLANILQIELWNVKRGKNTENQKREDPIQFEIVKKRALNKLALDYVQKYPEDILGNILLSIFKSYDKSQEYDEYKKIIEECRKDLELFPQPCLQTLDEEKIHYLLIQEKILTKYNKIEEIHETLERIIAIEGHEDILPDRNLKKELGAYCIHFVQQAENAGIKLDKKIVRKIKDYLDAYANTWQDYIRNNTFLHENVRILSLYRAIIDHPTNTVAEAKKYLKTFIVLTDLCARDSIDQSLFQKFFAEIGKIYFIKMKYQKAIEYFAKVERSDQFSIKDYYIAHMKVYGDKISFKPECFIQNKNEHKLKEALNGARLVIKYKRDILLKGNNQLVLSLSQDLPHIYYEGYKYISQAGIQNCDILDMLEKVLAHETNLVNEVYLLDKNNQFIAIEKKTELYLPHVYSSSITEYIFTLLQHALSADKKLIPAYDNKYYKIVEGFQGIDQLNSNSILRQRKSILNDYRHRPHKYILEVLDTKNISQSLVEYLREELTVSLLNMHDELNIRDKYNYDRFQQYSFFHYYDSFEFFNMVISARDNKPLQEELQRSDLKYALQKIRITRLYVNSIYNKADNSCSFANDLPKERWKEEWQTFEIVYTKREKIRWKHVGDYFDKATESSFPIHLLKSVVITFTSPIIALSGDIVRIATTVHKFNGKEIQNLGNTKTFPIECSKRGYELEGEDERTSNIMRLIHQDAIYTTMKNLYKQLDNAVDKIKNIVKEKVAEIFVLEDLSKVDQKDIKQRIISNVQNIGKAVTDNIIDEMYKEASESFSGNGVLHSRDREGNIVIKTAMSKMKRVVVERLFTENSRSGTTQYHID